MLNGYGDNSSIPSYGPAVLRLALGAVFIAHGGQKLFGLWGGGGLSGTAAYFAQLGLEPAFPLAVIAGCIEFFGGLLLVAGAFTFMAAIALAVQIAMYVRTRHRPQLDAGLLVILARISSPMAPSITLRMCATSRNTKGMLNTSTSGTTGPITPSEMRAI